MRDISLSWQDGSTLIGANALLQQYEIALFTGQQEFASDPTFGIGLESFLSEPASPATARAIKSVVESITAQYFPEVSIRSLSITKPAFNQITINLSIILVPYGLEQTINRTLEQ